MTVIEPANIRIARGAALLALLACRPPAEKPWREESGIDSANPDSAADSATESRPDSGETNGSEIEEVPGLVVDASDAVFDVEVIHTLSLTMDPDAWLTVRDNPWAETWASADLDFTFGQTGETETIEDVGVRAFGAGSMIAGKPALKISFDHNVSGVAWRELEQLKLDNSSQDQGWMNERVATGVVRAAHLPAARTGWARLEVNGEPAGFYVLMEPIDDRFVKRWFGDDEGPLYGMISGRWGQGLKPMDDALDWYEIQTSVSGDGTELVEAARRLAEGTDAEVAEVLDLDNFLGVGVARSLMGGIDTFSADGNNFYLYVDDGRIKQIPWDMDADLGYPWAYNLALAVDAEAPWLSSPWAYNAVTGEVYTDPVLERQLAMGADVAALTAELLAGPLDWTTLDAEVAASAALIRDDALADVLAPGAAFDARIVALRLFLHSRLSALAGGEVADCPPRDDGAVLLGALGPTGSVGWGSLTVDATSWGPGFNVVGQHYCSGLFAHAPSTVTVTLPAGVSVLTGAVGLQDWNQICGDGATFSVSQGGVVLWTSDSLGTDDAAQDMGEIAVSLGVLTLSASPNSEYSCDTASWLDVAVR